MQMHGGTGGACPFFFQNLHIPARACHQGHLGNDVPFLKLRLLRFLFPNYRLHTEILREKLRREKLHPLLLAAQMVALGPEVGMLPITRARPTEELWACLLHFLEDGLPA